MRVFHRAGWFDGVMNNPSAPFTIDEVCKVANHCDAKGTVNQACAAGDQNASRWRA
jgi:hypothetical protein